MFHRVELSESKIPEIYKKRGMVHSLEDLFRILDRKKIGTLEQALSNDRYTHITFDDGYKEHLEVANILKDRYNLKYGDITFAINVRNSYFDKKISMDLVYQLYIENRLSAISEKTSDISKIKKEIFSKDQKSILSLFKDQVNLKDIFLNSTEVKELSKIFTIASHGIDHFFMTDNIDSVEYQLKDSKKFLEKELSSNIDIFCYPEGKSNSYIENQCKKSGYLYGLGIIGGGTNFNIKRVIER